MQAAFVDIGFERAAFLYVSDVYRDDLKDYSFLLQEAEDEEIAEDHFQDSSEEEEENLYDYVLPKKLSPQEVHIEDVLKEGQELLVQVTKDPLGTKGPRVTMHASLPGRQRKGYG